MEIETTNETATTASGRQKARTSGRRIQVTGYVDPEIFEKLEAMARRERVSVSRVVGTLLLSGVTELREADRLDMISQALTVAVQDAVAKQVGSVRHLLARTAIEATATRGLMASQIAHVQGQDRARELSDGAYKHAVSSLQKPSAAVRELLAEPAPTPTTDQES